MRPQITLGVLVATVLSSATKKVSHLYQKKLRQPLGKPEVTHRLWYKLTRKELPICRLWRKMRRKRNSTLKSTSSKSTTIIFSRKSSENNSTIISLQIRPKLHSSSLKLPTCKLYTDLTKKRKRVVTFQSSSDKMKWSGRPNWCVLKSYKK